MFIHLSAPQSTASSSNDIDKIHYCQKHWKANIKFHRLRAHFFSHRSETDGSLFEPQRIFRSLYWRWVNYVELVFFSDEIYESNVQFVVTWYNKRTLWKLMPIFYLHFHEDTWKRHLSHTLLNIQRKKNSFDRQFSLEISTYWK